MGRFETELLADDENLAALADLLGQWIDRVHARHLPKAIVLDIDSSVSLTYGDQEGTAYDGDFARTCHHPLFMFNQLGNLEYCALRPGNVHSADDWHSIIEPVVARYRDKVRRRFFRGDAAFAAPDIYEFLEAEGYKYTIRLNLPLVFANALRPRSSPARPQRRGGSARGHREHGGQR
jgi:hypothetical protein